MAIFTATALPATPDKINVDAGNNQTGVVDESLPSPFVAVVTDAGHNRLANVPVTFLVLQGGGNFNGLSTFTTNFDSGIPNASATFSATTSDATSSATRCPAYLPHRTRPAGTGHNPVSAQCTGGECRTLARVPLQ